MRFLKFLRFTPLLLTGFILCLVVFTASLPLAVNAAGVPSILSYQGRLTDSSGNLLGSPSGTTYFFRFSLWDNPNIGSGSRVWPAAVPTSVSSSVKGGVFTVNIGDTANGYPDPLNYNFNSNKIYLQVEVSSDNATFETLSPRQQISSAAFAQISGAVSGVGQSSIGTTSPGSNAVLTVEATSTSSIALLVRGILSQVANLFEIRNSAGTPLLTVDGNGVATFASVVVNGITSLQNFNFVNATGTNATSTNLFTSNLSVGNLSGFLKATAGSVATSLVNLTADVTGVLPVANGGTGSTTLSGILVGNGTSAVNSLIIGSGLSLTGTTLSTAGAGITSLGAQYSSGQVGGSQTFATTSDTNLGLTITSSGNIHTFSPVWFGTLAAGRGGTGLSTVSASQLLIGNSTGTGWTQVATSSLGLLTNNVAEGSSLYFTNARADARINATSTLGTLTSAPNLSTISTSLSGFLKATSGALSTGLVNLASDVTGTLPVANGGTGSTTLSGILLGNGTSALNTVTLGSGLTLTGTTLSTSGAGITAFGPLGQTQSGGTQILATTTSPFNGLTAGITIVGAGNTQTFTPTLSGTLGVGGGGTGATSFTTSQLLYGNSTGALLSVATTTLTSQNGITLSGAAGALVGGSNATIGLATINAGVLGAVANGSVPTSQATSTLYGVGAPGQVLAFLNGALQFTATSTLATIGGTLNLSNQVNSTLAVANGGTGSTTLSGLLKGNGTGQVATAIAGTDYVANTSGDWTGTFGTHSQSFYLDSNNLTNFGIPFYSLFHSTTTDALAEGSVNKYYTDTRAGAYISGSSTIPHIGGSAFGDLLSWTGSAWDTRATSSLNINFSNLVGAVADNQLASTFLKTIGSGATGQVAYWNGANSLASVATSSIVSGANITVTNGGSAFVLGAQPTISLSGTIGVGNGGLGISAVPDGALLFGGVGGGTANLSTLASSTGGFLTNSYTTGRPVWNATSTLGIALSDTVGTLGVSRGGTASTTLSGILKGNGTGAIQTAIAGTDYENPLTFSGPLSRAGNTISIPAANGSTNGYLASGDWTTFNNKISSTSLSSGAGISYNSGTGVIGNTGLLSLAQTSGAAQTGALTFATSSQTANGQTLGFNITNSGGTFAFAPTLSGTLGVAGGGTGSTTLTGLLKGNGIGSLISAIAGTDYQAPISLTTTGTSGAAAFSNNTLNIPQYSGTTYTGTYPVQVSGSSISLAFGTTTSNTWAGTQTFTNSPVFSTVGAGVVNATAGGTLYNTATSTPILASEFSYGGTLGSFIGGTSGALSLATNGTALSKLVQVAANTILGNNTGAIGNVTAFATSTLGIALSDTTGTLGVSRGGTASTTLGGILAGNGTSAVKSVVVGSGLTWDGTTLSTNGAGITALGPVGQTQSGGTQTLATTTSSFNGLTAGVTIVGAGNTQTFTPSLSGTLNVAGGGTGSTTLSGLLKGNGTGSLLSALAGTDYENPLTFSAPLSRVGNTISIPAATGSTNGYLASTDWTTFNNKISSTSLSAGSGISYNSGTGVIGNTGVLSLAQTSGSAQSGALTFATTSQTTNGQTLGLNITNSGSTFTFAPTLSGTLGVAGGGTGSTTLSGLLKGNGTGTVATAILGTDYLAPASLSATYPLAYNSGTGVFSTAFGTTTANTYSAANTFNGGVTIGALNGVLYGNNGAVTSTATSSLAASSEFSYSGTLGALVGGTGGTLSLATNGTAYSKLAQAGANTILGNNTGATGNVTAFATSTLFGTGTGGQVLAWNNGVPQFVATTTFSSGLSYANGNVTNTGVTSNLAGTGISVSGATGAVTISNTGVLSLAQSSGSAQTGALTLATSTLAVNGQTLGVAITNSGGTFTFTPTLSGTLGVAGGGTGQSTFSPSQLLYGNGSGALVSVATSTLTSQNGITLSGGAGALVGGSNATIGLATINAGVLGAVTNGSVPTSQATSTLYGLGTNGFVLAEVNGVPQWVATSTLATIGGTLNLSNQVNSTLGVVNGGTGSTTLSGILIGNGASQVNSLTVGSGLTLTGTTLSTSGAGITALGPLGQTQSGGTQTLASSTSSFNGLTAGVTIVGAGNTQTFTPTISGTLGVGGGGTGLAAAADGALIFGGIGGGSANFATLATSTGGFLSNSYSTGRPVWNATSTLNIATANLVGTIADNQLASTFLKTAVTSLAQTYGSTQTGAATLATSTTGTDFSITNSGANFTFNLPSASASNRGLLTSSDWTTFNSKLGAAITAIGPVGQTQTGATQTLATTTSSFNGLTAGVTIVGSGNTQTFTPTISGTLNVAGGGTGSTTLTGLLKGNGIGSLISAIAGTDYENPLTFSGPLSRAGNTISIPAANGSTNGYLASGDWTTFNNKISSSSLSATYPLAYNSGTGVFTTAFGTTTANTYSAPNTFNGGVTIGALNGVLYGNNGSVTSTATSTPTLASEFSYGGTLGSFIGGTSGTLSLATNGTAYSKLAQAGANTILGNNTGVTGNVTAFATSSLGIALSDTVGTLGVSRGGTGSTTLSGILIGNGTSQVNSLTVGSGLTLTGTTLSTSGAGITALGPLGQTQSGGTQTLATSTSSFNGLTAGVTIVGAGNTQTFTPTISGTLNVAGGGTGSTTLTGLLKGNGTGSLLSSVAGVDYENPLTFSGPLSRAGNTISIPAANGSTNGYLASTDWSTFNNKISSTSLSAGTGISYNSGTGVIGNTGVLSLVQNGGGSAQTGALTFATTSQTTNGQTVGLNITNSGASFTFAPTITGTLNVAGGGTGSTTLSGLLKGNGTSQLATAILGTDYLAPASLSAAYPLAYNSGTGVFTTAFGTTTSNTWAGTQTFTNSPVFSTLGAGTVNSTAAGTLYNTATSTPTLASEFSYSGILGQFMGGTSGALSLATNGTAYSKLAQTGANTILGNNTGAIGNVTAFATSTLGIALSDTVGTLGVSRGGTGSTTLSGILKGNGTGAIQTAIAGTDYENPLTFSGPLSRAGNTISIPAANGSTNGYLASGDWTTFNNKISSSSLSATYPLAYNSGTGVFTTAFGTTTTNTYSSLNTFNGGLTIGSLNGPLQANNGVVSATTSIGVVYGGTASTTLGGILAGNGTSAVKSVVVGSGLTWDGTTLATNGSGITSLGPVGQTQTGATQTLATTTSSFNGLTAALTIVGSGNTQTFTPSISGTLNVAGGGTGSTTLTGILKGNGIGSLISAIAGTDYENPLTFSGPLSRVGNTISIPAATGSTNGYLASGDWTTFNNKISSTSLSSGAGISYNSGTGVIGNTGLLSLAQTSGAAQTGALTFATSSATSFNGLSISHTITNSGGTFTFNTPTITGTLGVGGGGTGLAAAADGALIFGGVGGGSAPLVALATSSGGTILQTSFATGRPTWVATSTLGFLSSAVTAIGPTGQTSAGPTVTLATTTSSFNGLTSGLTIVGAGNTQTFTPTLSGTLGVAGGGTGATTLNSSQLLYGAGSGAVQSVATSSLAASSEFAYSGTLGALVGGASGTLSLATNGTAYSKLAQAGANTILGNNTGVTGNVTAFATSSLGIALSDTVGTLGVSRGGTGSTTLSGILIGNGTSQVNSLTVGSGLTLTGTTLSTSGAGITALGPLGQTQSGGTQTLATSTSSFNGLTAGVTIVGAGNTQTFTPTISGTLGVGGGGTGWAAIQSGAIPYGNGSSALSTTTAGTAGQVLALLNGIPTWTATTTFSSGLAYANGNVTNTGLLSLAQTSGAAQTGAITLATSTTAINNDWGITNTGGTFTFNLPTATATVRGLLSAADWTTFNGKQAALGFTYPLVNTANTISLAFGTTTNNTWAGTQTFTNSPVFSTVGAGVVNATAGGTLYNTATSTPTLASEFSYSGTLGALVGGASGTLSLATNGTALSKLVQVGANTILGNNTGVTGNVTAFATSSLGIALSDTVGTLGVARGGTGQTTFNSSQLLYGASSGAVQSVATTTLTSNNGITLSGAAGALVGGSNATIGLATINAGVLGAVTNGSVPTSLATSTLYGVGTNGFVLAEVGGVPTWVATTTLATIGGTLNLSNQVTNTLGVTNGGTGSTTLSGILIGNGTSQVNSLTIGSGLSLIGTTLSASGSGITALGPFGQTQSGGTQTLATTTSSFNGLTAALTIVGAGNTQTFTPSLSGTLNLAGGGTATTTFYNGGVVFSDGSKLTQAASPSSFFWDNTNNRLGLGTSTPGSLLSVQGIANFTTATSSIYTGLYVGTGTSSPIATNVVGMFSQQGATGLVVRNSAVGNEVALFAGNNAAGDTSVGSISNSNFKIQTNNTEVARFTAAGLFGIGSTTPGSLLSIGGVANFTAATSTLYGTGGINITSGCFSIGNICIGAGGSGISNLGPLGQLQSGSTITLATSTLAQNGQTHGLTIVGSGNTLTFTPTLSGTLGVGGGGTGQTTFTGSQLLYGAGTGALQSVATSSLAVGTSLSSSGTLGAQIGGSNTTLSLNLGNANSWTALQSFLNATSTLFSNTGTAYFGGIATSTFSNAGALTLASALGVSSGGTGSTTLSGILKGNGTSQVGTVLIGANLAWDGTTLSGSGGGGYATVQDEGSNVTARAILNFTGAGVTCADNSGSSRTDCTINGGAAAAGSTGGIQFNTGNAFDAVTSFVWDKTNSRHGIGTTTPWATLSASSTSAYPVAVFDQRGTGNILNLQSGGVDKITLSNNGTLNVVGTSTLPVIAPVSDSTTAIRVLKSDGSTTVITFDTSNTRVQIGTGAGSANPALLVLDTKSTTGDPTGVNGAMYYNSNKLRFRCFDNSVWTDCGERTDMVNFLATSTPATPAAGELRVFGRTVAGRVLPAFIGPSGLDSALQPFLARNKIGYWNPQGNSTAQPGVFGFTTLTVVSNGATTPLARNVAVTNTATRMRRLGFITTAVAGIMASSRMAVAQFTLGDAGNPPNGGFTMIARFVPSDAAAVSGERFFLGMSSNTGVPTNVDPAAQLNQIGIAQLSTGTDCFIVYGGSVAQAAIDLGSSFNCSTLSTQAYELALFASPALNNTVYYQVTRLTDGLTTSGTLTGTAGTALPSSSTLLGFTAWKTNNATAAAAAYDLASVYIETDN